MFEYDIQLTADDYAGNTGTLNRTIVVYSALDGETVNSETITAALPKVVLLKDAEYTCGMAGVSVELTNNTLTTTCQLPDTSSLGDKEVSYEFSK